VIKQKKIGEATLYCADCKEVLPLLKDIDACVTDPPYGLSFMGKAWDYDVPSQDIWSLVFDSLKLGGHLLSFFGSRTYHRGVIPIEDAGFEIRDQLMWFYGSGFPKSHNIGKKIEQYEGWGTALKPAHEPIVMARKPFKGTVAENVLEHGTGGINIDDSRVDADNDAKVRIRKAGSEFGQNSNWNDHKNIDTVYDPTKGRFPANVMHDGSESVQNIFEDKARYFYCAKANKKDRDEGNNHPTVKPTELMRYLCRLVTPKGCVVLDPFMGSGSTGKAAIMSGYKFVGVEMDEEYFEIACARIEAAHKQRGLF